MGLLGEAVVVLWFDIDADRAAEFEDWHSHEHMPERLRVPGFRRGVRWMARAGAPSYFVMYEVASFDTLISAPYLERLNNPTPWTTKVMPCVRNTIRSLCRTRSSFGVGVGQTILTIRLSPVRGREDALRGWLIQAALPGLARRPGIVGAHLIEAEAPAGVPKVKEQELRGGDASADWVILVQGYDSDAIAGLPHNDLRREVLAQHGASSEQVDAVYCARFALTDADVTALDRSA